MSDVSFGMFAAVVLIVSAVSFKAGAWFAEDDVVIRLIIKYQQNLLAMGEQGASKSVVAWLYWKTTPFKWFDNPEEP